MTIRPDQISAAYLTALVQERDLLKEECDTLREERDRAETELRALRAERQRQQQEAAPVSAPVR